MYDELKYAHRILDLEFPKNRVFPDKIDCPNHHINDSGFCPNCFYDEDFTKSLITQRDIELNTHSSY